MNTQRAVMWAGFLSVSAVLAWAPGHWFGLDTEVAPFAGKPAPTGTESFSERTDNSDPVGAGSSERRTAANRPAQSPKDLFPSQRWSKPQTLATVTEQPAQAAPAAPATPTAPVLPFQFIGRLGDRDDQQVFLQSGEKLYVVRQGDVIDDTYRLDRVSASELNLVYLPLHQSQTLSVGSAP